VLKPVERISFVTLLFLLILIPIPLASNRAWAWSLIEVIVSLQTLLIIIAYKGTLPWQKLKSVKWLLIPFTLFQVWTLCQIIPLPNLVVEWLSPHAAAIYHSINAPTFYLSLDREQSFISLLKGLTYTLVIVNAGLLITSAKRIKTVILILIISATFQAFYGSLMVLLKVNVSPIFSLPEVNISTGSFVYKNHLANYLMLVLTMGIGLIITELHSTASKSWAVRLKRWVTAILSAKMMIRLSLIIMVIALVMTRSRMGNTAFFAATVAGGIIALAMYKNRPRALTGLIISILVIDTLIVGSLFGLEKVKQRLIETSAQTESRDQVVIWGLDIIKDYPLTGTGAGSFYSIFPSYTQYDVGTYDHAHNEYLQFAIESGIPATLLLAAAIIYCLYQSISTIRHRHSNFMKGIALGCFMAIIGMLIHISVDFNLQPPANTVTFIVILVIACLVRVMPRVTAK
jgi:O-antigen ligase